jgi:hypothetical protein
MDKNKIIFGDCRKMQISPNPKIERPITQPEGRGRMLLVAL